MKLKVKRNITVNGKNNLKGSIIEIEDKDAKVILDRGWAEKLEAETKPAEDPKEKPEKVEEVAEVKEKPQTKAKPAPAKKAAPKKAAAKKPAAKKAAPKQAKK